MRPKIASQAGSYGSANVIKRVQFGAQRPVSRSSHRRQARLGERLVCPQQSAPGSSGQGVVGAVGLCRGGGQLAGLLLEGSDRQAYGDRAIDAMKEQTHKLAQLSQDADRAQGEPDADPLSA